MKRFEIPDGTCVLAFRSTAPAHQPLRPTRSSYPSIQRGRP